MGATLDLEGKRAKISSEPHDSEHAKQSKEELVTGKHGDTPVETLLDFLDVKEYVHALVKDERHAKLRKSKRQKKRKRCKPLSRFADLLKHRQMTPPSNPSRANVTCG